MTFGLGGIAEAFGDRNFRWYSLGSVVSWLSFFVQAVAVSWTAWDLTHSTAWLAIVALADATANIVLMPIGGVRLHPTDPTASPVATARKVTADDKVTR